MSSPRRQFDLRTLFTDTCVGELTLTHVPLLQPGQTGSEAAEAMRNVSHGSALVCEEGRLIGILTERDLLRVIADDGRMDSPVTEIMTVNPRTVTTGDTLLEAVRRMDEKGCRRLPVVDADQRPAGIVDVKMVVNFLVEQVSSTVYNQAENRLLTVRNREGA